MVESRSSDADLREGSEIPPAASLAPLSQWLDLIRWVAAAAVLVSHAQNRYLIKAGELAADERGPLHLAFAFSAGFAHHAVMAFFVLSGFLVGGKVLSELGSGSFNPKRYLIDRLSRLFVVLAPALLVTWLIAVIITASFSGSSASFYYYDTADNIGVPTLICNLAFLQTMVCNTYAGNGALWTLANEFWYYLTMPALLALTALNVNMRLIFKGLICLTLLIILTMLQSSGAPLLAYSVVWLVGAMSAKYAREKGPALSPLVAGLIYMIVLVCLRIFVRGEWLYQSWVVQTCIDVGIALLLGLWLFSLRRKGSMLKSPPLQRLHTLLASFSFSLYCLHVPILNLVAFTAESIFGRAWRLSPSDPLAWGIMAAGCAMSIGAAFIFSRLTERNTRRFRSALIRRSSTAFGAT